MPLTHLYATMQQAVVAAVQNAPRLDQRPGRSQGATSHLLLDGLGLASEYLQEVDGKAAMRSHTVMRWDASRRVFIMHFVTADGGHATILEGRREGDRVIFEGVGPNGPMRQTFDYGADTLGVAAAAPGAASGEWSMLFQGRYSPASGASEWA